MLHNPNLDISIILFRLRVVIYRCTKLIGQKEVAKIIGTHQSNISRALNPDNNVKIDTLVKWVKALGFQVEFEVYPDTQREVRNDY